MVGVGERFNRRAKMWIHSEREDMKAVILERRSRSRAEDRMFESYAAHINLNSSDRASSDGGRIYSSGGFELRKRT